jgi:Protein of unknown function (DUF1573)
MRIISVQASCGCTTPGWTQGAIPHGASGFVKASFDPKGRLGYFNKSLTVTTDLEGGPVILQIKGQVNGKDHVVGGDDYPVEKGTLHFKLSTFNLDKVFINLPASPKEFPVYNAGNKPVHFTEQIVGPAYIKATVPKELAPYEKGIITITYDPKMKGRYGFVSDNISITTDDEVQPQKSFSVYATIEEFFPSLTTAEYAKAPVLRLETSAIDLGKIHEGNTIDREVGLRNAGQQELIVRALQENCSCLKTSLDILKIKPGSTARLKITLLTQGRAGMQQKAVTLYTNDPKYPVQRVTITAYVE